MSLLSSSVFAESSQVSTKSSSDAKSEHLITHLSQAQVESSNFDDIKKRGRLRIIISANIGGGSYLPRNGSPVSQQHEIAEAFAHRHGLVPELIITDSFGEMIPALAAGKGDIIVGNLTVTESRRKHIEFSVPLDHVREQVLVNTDNDSIHTVSDLNHKRVMVSHASTFWEALLWLKENKYKHIDLVPRPKDLVDEDEIDLLVKGEIDATIRDSNIVDMYSTYRDGFKVATNFSNQRDIAWGVRKKATGLLLALNEFLQLEHLAHNDHRIHTDDFDFIKKRRVLRVLLRNNASSYFLYKGELMGFEYELARKFARSHGLRLEVVVPPSHRELLSWLVEGRADLAIGFLEPNEKRKAMGIAFSTPYNHEAQHVVVHKGDGLKNLQELTSRTVTVRPSSSYWQALQRLHKEGYSIPSQAAPENMETEELIRQVANKNIEVTFADAHILDIELAKSTAVKSAFTLGEKRPQAIAIRQQNTQLVAAVNDFINRNHRGKFYNVLYNKYFKSRKSIKRLARGRIENLNTNRLSPWDETTRRYAERYGFDWRLITAQMYQESRFNPNARSFAGAEGLMQLMPRTAKSIGIKDLKNPEDSIHGGVKYMDWLRDRFDDKLPVSVKLWFTLAAYNAGHGHVRDAQRLARQKGWDDTRWFDHTEKAMLLLSKKTYSSKARYGYVDGEEPVKYVREIKNRFEAYVNLKVDNEQPVLSLNDGWP
jgi:membrane-bound lytic murein transglycosylase F